jgi:hypothetical protein
LFLQQNKCRKRYGEPSVHIQSILTTTITTAAHTRLLFSRRSLTLHSPQPPPLSLSPPLFSPPPPLTLNQSPHSTSHPHSPRTYPFNVQSALQSPLPPDSLRRLFAAPFRLLLFSKEAAPGLPFVLCRAQPPLPHHPLLRHE